MTFLDPVCRARAVTMTRTRSSVEEGREMLEYAVPVPSVPFKSRKRVDADLAKCFGRGFTCFACGRVL